MRRAIQHVDVDVRKPVGQIPHWLEVAHSAAAEVCKSVRV
jgi:hypothetical protein